MKVFLLGIMLLNASSPGRFAGQVVDGASRQPLPGVNIVLVGTEMGAATDEFGRYVVDNVPAGEHSIEVSMIGYRTQVITRVEAVPGRTVFLDFELTTQAIGMSTVTVRPEYFNKDATATSSEVRLNYHEMRSNPEGYNVIRTISALPGVATGFDFSSDISVRGGDPDENLAVIDNLPVAYPVHFPALGGGFGQSSIVSIETLDDVEFSPGGYAARYSGKLSSLMDITLRDGNQDKFEAMFDLNMSALGVSVEGPIGQNINYIAAYHRSFLGIIDLVSDIGDVIPSFDDFYLRVAYRPSPSHKIWGFAIQTLDRMHIPETNFGGANTAMNWNGYQTIAGLNWRALIGEMGYSVLTLGGCNLENRLIAPDTSDDEEFGHYIPHETYLYLKQAFAFNPWAGHEIQTGAMASYTMANYDFYRDSYIDPYGEEVPAEDNTTEGSCFTVSPYAQYIYSPWQWLKFTPGISLTYNDLNCEVWLEPRVGISLKPFKTTSFNLNYGIYHQLHQYDIQLEDTDLAAKKATHYIAGIEQLIRDDLKLTVEGYYKQLEGLIFYSDADSAYLAEETGTSCGLEVLAQKKMGKFFYGQTSYSLSFSERTNADDGTYPGDWDVRHMLTLVGGVRFLKNFEFSVKYHFATGQPWTPYDVDNATLNPLDSLWYVERVDDRNSGRIDNYSRLDLQIGHTSYTKGGIAISGYFNLQNALNHPNVVSYGWDAEQAKVVPYHNFFIMPVGGVTIRF